MDTQILQRKIPRKKLMEMYSLSKSKILQLEARGVLIPLYFDVNSRLPYYDIDQIESALKPSGTLNN